MNMPERLLNPKEVLRVMDAAQVIHERQAALEEHEALDREATIREIQIMYEELGDLVDARVIEEALDEYLAQRYAFTPPRPGFGNRLALLYIRRGWVTKRVMLPAAGVAALVWGGFALTDAMRTNALERDADRLRAEVARWRRPMTPVSTRSRRCVPAASRWTCRPKRLKRSGRVSRPPRASWRDRRDPGARSPMRPVSGNSPAPRSAA